MKRSRRGFKGVAAGTVVAVIVLVAVAAYGMVRLTETASLFYRSTAEYATVAQKPVFRIAEPFRNGTVMVFPVVNLGPSPAVVREVALYYYGSNNVVSGATVVPVNAYVPVGARIDVAVPTANLSQYYFIDRSLIADVVTDRGIVTASLPASTSTITVNLRVPGWLRTVDNSFYSKIWISLADCDGPTVPLNLVYPATSSSTYATGSWNLTVTTGSDWTYTLWARVPGFAGQCMVRITSRDMKLLYPVAGNSDWRANPSAIIPVYYTIQQRAVDYAAGVYVTPGGAPVVDIDLPQILYDPNLPPNPPSFIQSTQVIDFSWYYHIVDGTNSWANENEILDTVYKLGTQFASAFSPAGCVVYPSPGVDLSKLPSDIREKIREALSKPEVRYGTFISDVRTTGLPFLVTRPEKCPYASQHMVVIVPIQLSRGKYLVTPVFTFHDADSDNYYVATINVSVISPSGRLVASTAVAEGDETAQFAPTLTVDAFEDGNYTLKLAVSPSNTGYSASWIILILSKVVVTRLGAGVSYVKTIQSPSLPTFPFAVVDLTTGSVLRASSIAFAPMMNSGDVTTACDNYLYRTGLITCPSKTLSGIGNWAGGTVFIGDKSFADVRRHYIANGFRVDVYVNNMAMPFGTVDAGVYLVTGTGPYDYPWSVGMYMVHPLTVTPPYSYDIRVTITFGATGDYVVIVPFDYLGNVQVNKIVSSGVSVASDRVNGNGPYAYVARVQVVQPGATLTLAFSGSGLVLPGIFYLTSVVVAPAPSGGIPITGTSPYSVGAGIVLRNVRLIDRQYPASATLVRADTGTPIVSWSIPNTIPDGSTVVLDAGALLTANAHYLVESVPFALVLTNIVAP